MERWYHCNRFSIKIDAVSSEHILELANLFFDETKLTSLSFIPEK